MPIYCYRHGGKRIEQFFYVGQAPKTVIVAGVEYARDFAEERVGVPAKGWPLECIASGVHADQAGELRDHLKKSGVPTEVTPDGNPVYRDADHRRRALKVRGMVDRNSFL